MTTDIELKDEIIKILQQSEMRGLESDNTTSVAGLVYRNQYEEVAKRIVKLFPVQNSMTTDIDKNYQLIPVDKITDKVREIAKRWYDGVSELDDIRQKHKLASDIMNYAEDKCKELQEAATCECGDEFNKDFRGTCPNCIAGITSGHVMEIQSLLEVNRKLGEQNERWIETMDKIKTFLKISV